MMEDVFTFVDKLGPLKVIHVHEPSIGLKAVLVVDNVAKGPSIGGMRMATDVSTEECLRLARAMTSRRITAWWRQNCYIR
jgi:glutamate dehydrogenase (NAD(P)+)